MGLKLYNWSILSRYLRIKHICNDPQSVTTTVADNRNVTESWADPHRTKRSICQAPATHTVETKHHSENSPSIKNIGEAAMQDEKVQHENAISESTFMNFVLRQDSTLQLPTCKPYHRKFPSRKGLIKFVCHKRTRHSISTPIPLQEGMCKENLDYKKASLWNIDLGRPGNVL